MGSSSESDDAADAALKATTGRLAVPPLPADLAEAMAEKEDELSEAFVFFPFLITEEVETLFSVSVSSISATDSRSTATARRTGGLFTTSEDLSLDDNLAVLETWALCVSVEGASTGDGTFKGRTRRPRLGGLPFESGDATDCEEASED